MGGGGGDTNRGGKKSSLRGHHKFVGVRQRQSGKWVAEIKDSLQEVTPRQVQASSYSGSAEAHTPSQSQRRVKDDRCHGWQDMAALQYTYQVHPVQQGSSALRGVTWANKPTIEVPCDAHMNQAVLDNTPFDNHDVPATVTTQQDTTKSMITSLLQAWPGAMGAGIDLTSHTIDPRQCPNVEQSSSSKSWKASLTSLPISHASHDQPISGTEQHGWLNEQLPTTPQLLQYCNNVPSGGNWDPFHHVFSVSR